MSPLELCRSCGAPSGRRRDGFCSWQCRRNRENTKMVRGGKLHDMLVEWRSSYKNRHLLTQIGRMVAGWIEEDKRVDHGKAVHLSESE